MNLIDNLTDQANQTSLVTLQDGTVLQLNLQFMASIQRWVANLSHPSLTTRNLMLDVNANLLRPWRSLLNFGLACVASDGVDPFDVEDFANGRCQLFALTEADKILVEENVFGGLLQ